MGLGVGLGVGLGLGLGVATPASASCDTPDPTYALHYPADGKTVPSDIAWIWLNAFTHDVELTLDGQPLAKKMILGTTVGGWAIPSQLEPGAHTWSFTVGHMPGVIHGPFTFVVGATPAALPGPPVVGDIERVLGCSSSPQLDDTCTNDFYDQDCLDTTNTQVVAPVEVDDATMFASVMGIDHESNTYRDYLVRRGCDARTALPGTYLCDHPICVTVTPFDRAGRPVDEAAVTTCEQVPGGSDGDGTGDGTGDDTGDDGPDQGAVEGSRGCSVHRDASLASLAVGLAAWLAAWMAAWLAAWMAAWRMPTGLPGTRLRVDDAARRRVAPPPRRDRGGH